MVAVGPMVRTAIKFAPLVLEAARQLDQKVRPHLRAYQLARSVDGVVGSWTIDDGTHWVVFDHDRGRPLQAFPSLTAAELERAGREVDRRTLKPHTDLPEHALRERLETAGDATANLVAKVRRRGQTDPGSG
jgi:hypothetical protein